MSDAALGLACACGAVILFGTNYIPVRQYDCGDGFFFQWCMCAGIWLVGIVIALVHPYSSSPPPTQPLAVLGGCVWATAQLRVPFIVTAIGTAKGLILWGSTAMLAGWFCGAFGLLGVRSQADEIHSWPLNLSGLGFALVSLAASLMLKPEPHPNRQQAASLTATLLEEGEVAAATKAPPSQTAGVASALVAGIFFGINFNGAQYVLDRAATDECLSDGI